VSDGGTENTAAAASGRGRGNVRPPPGREQALFAYVARLGDNVLILGQRMVELVAGYPELEEELANANFALDYIGQARMFYTYAGELEGEGRDEDDFAFLRDEQEFRNFLLLELPNGHFGDSITRLVLFDAFYLRLLEALKGCRDRRITEIAARAEKEIRYHLRHNSQWLIRLGDGTDESHERVQQSLHDLWQYTGELFAADEIDEIFAREFGGPDLGVIRDRWRADIKAILDQATLAMPDDGWMASGGKQGRHSEHLGYVLAEMQYLERRYPGAEW
jgi:ring-1,2-phenylacetyl-CoA epoxidase subunit PaaC